MRYKLAVAVGLVTLFVVSRVALLETSYDANQNWEEPVFLFSATALAHDGIGRIFDHQDDLNHGGSVALLALAVPWVRTLGTSLVTLKGLAILWSTITLVAFMAVGWRYLSPQAALVWGAATVALSPTAARLDVTLVGSHPEALLPCALALGVYLAWARGRHTPSGERVMLAALLGLWCGVALWISYASIMFVAPLFACRAAFLQRRHAFAIVGGFAVGWSPWMYQNLWLRPHGAWLWQQHLAPTSPDGVLVRVARAVAEVAASFGYDGAGGWLLLAACAAALAMLSLALLWPRSRTWLGAPPLVVAPFVAAAYVGLVLLVGASIPVFPNEGYYHYRFYMPLQAGLFWVLALGVDRLPAILGRTPVALASALMLAYAVASQAQLYDQGNHYQADLASDRARGCQVFGIAEYSRSPDLPTAIGALRVLEDEKCRERAFTGLAWGIADRYLTDHDLAAATTALEAMPDRDARWAACAGFNFVLTHAPEGKLTSVERAAAGQRIAAYCREARPS